jgi:hypothetical protein
MQCATHPSVETELACGKCGKPICPRCLVYTPVGTRCRECANIRRLPQYNIPASFLLRGAGAALVAGAVLGAVWGWFFPFGLSFFFGLLVGAGLGYAIGESVSIATNRKVGPPLQALAALGVIVAYLVHALVLVSSFKDVEFMDVVRRDQFGYVVVILAAVVAMGRVR